MGKPKPKENPINNHVAISDTHCGSKHGLCVPWKVRLPESSGAFYLASKHQKRLWKQWNFACKEFIPDATRGEPFVVIHNGDAVDGDHHNTSTIISRNLAVQAEIAGECLEVIMAVPGFRGLYAVGGTPAHVGEAWCEEERLFRQLGAIPDSNGNSVRGELWIMCGPRLGHYAHHIGTTSSGAYETSALAREANELYAEAAKRGLRPPDFIVRSHRHLRSEIRVAREKQDAIVLVTAAWQLKTPFVQKTAGGRVMSPQTGLSVIRYHEGQLFTRHETWYVDRPRVEVPRYREGE